MKKSIMAFSLFLISNYGISQKVYTESVASRADKSIYFEEVASRADLKICFTDVKSRAGWKNSSKKSLMY
jgi:hypothetical protein